MNALNENHREKNQHQKCRPIPAKDNQSALSNLMPLEAHVYYNTNPQNFDPLLNANQVAERLSCSKSQAYAMMRKRIFPVVSMGRMIRVRASSLEAYIEKMEHDSIKKQPLYLQNFPQYYLENLTGGSHDS